VPPSELREARSAASCGVFRLLVHTAEGTPRRDLETLPARSGDPEESDRGICSRASGVHAMVERKRATTSAAARVGLIQVRMSTTRRTAGVHSRKRPLGPNGEKICYNCGGPLPKGKPFNCSSKCSEEWACRTSPSILRSTLFKRDRGVCAVCRVDTEALKKEFHTIREQHPRIPNTDPARRIRKDSVSGASRNPVRASF